MLRNSIAQRKLQGYDILAQEWVNEHDTPIESGFVDWNAKYTKIGRIVIDSPSLIETPSAEDFCRAATFNPWNTASDYQPVGGIQRVRKVVYTGLQKLRRSYQVQLQKNIVPAGANYDITLAQVQQHYPLTGTSNNEVELNEAEFDSAESNESGMGQATWDFDREELKAENDEEIDVNVHVNLQ